MNELSRPNPLKVALVSNSAPVLPAWVGAELESAGARFVARECTTADELRQTAADAQIVWVFGGGTICDEKNVRLLAQCRFLLRSGTGTDNVAVEEATKLGITVGNTPVAAAATVADHAAALLLALVRQIPMQDRHLRTGVYDRSYAFPDWHLAGATLGLLGFGRIAQLMARRMAAFDVKLIAHDPYVDPNCEPARQLGVRFVSLDELFSQSDFLSIHCPLTPQTRHLVNEQRLRMMKPRAMIVNTARGPIIDEAALARVLAEKRIAGAALDVHEVEPLPPDSPLLRLENVVMTPHTAGHSDTIYHDFWRDSVDTIRQVLCGRPPRWLVNRPPSPRQPALW
ncbi:2-hydroxyacid dehydrogenase [Fontivita pretiosa]|uniref:2-hydroxyacid dehydrogenase n=1 Tax=Fontivita pretiosa TaxID=2989684 RepID=UPI003D167C69